MTGKRRNTRRTNTNQTNLGHRDTYDITNPSRLVVRSTKKTKSDLTAISDRRRFHPDGEARPAPSFKKSRHRLTERSYNRPKAGKKYKTQSFVTKIGFEEPEKVLVCVRRKIREEVLHAFKKTGRRGQKRKKFNFYSSISCKKGR